MTERAPALRLDHLRCELLRDPLGIDVGEPRLSWVLESSERNRKQSAYQVLATDASGAQAWDSGKVVSDSSVHVPWRGRPLRSRDRIIWKVRIWDELDRSTDWSDPAKFEMGLLERQAWKAEWIAAAAEQERLPVLPFVQWQDRWIGLSEAGQAKAYFRRFFQLPENGGIRKAFGVLMATGELELFVNGRSTIRSQAIDQAVPLDLSGLLRPGANLLALSLTRLEGAPRLACAARFVIERDGGAAIDIRTGKEWRVSREPRNGWQETDFDAGNWDESLELAQVGAFPFGRFALPARVLPAPLLRKSFGLTRKVAAARAYACGLGYFELYVNGRRIGDHVLDPAFTRYDQRVLYVTHDVTQCLVQGENVLGVMLGNGFFNTHAQDEWDFHQAPWRATPRLLLSLHIDYADGTSEVIGTDDSWQASSGPVVLDGVRNGETYDARLERPSWATPADAEEDWHSVVSVAGPSGQLSAQVVPPIRVTETLRAVALTQPRPKVFVFDFGQNFAGWARLTVTGPRGATVTLRYGERLADDGTLQQQGIWQFVQQGPFQTDRYTLKGEGEETWEPRFTYHGFRYVEVTGFPGVPDIECLQGRVAHTAFETIGQFECSNQLLNAVWRAALWSYRSNFHSIPTDCPHREKNGWMGDGHIAVELGMYNFDNAASYAKWVRDMADEQAPNGALPGIVPTSGWGYQWGNGPAWDSALLLVPWYLYLYTGDRRILETHYASMKRYVDYLGTRSYMEENPSGWLGDWLALDQSTPEAVTHAAFHVQDALTVALTARLLNQPDEAACYESISDSVRQRFVERFVDRETGRVSTGSQTAQCSALLQILEAGPLRDQAFQRLVENIEAERRHLNFGLIGSKFFSSVLTSGGRADLVYAIVSQRDFPSWGYWIENGATTLWEDWHGNASRNHIFLGDVTAWFYWGLAGIRADPSAPGFEHIIFHPEVVGDLSWVKAETRTVRGRVASEWRRDGDELKLELCVPANSTASVYVPAPASNRVDADGARWVGVEPGRQIYEIGSGSYTFRVRGG
ncbi:MAG TPA: family 78 glycoside hydrolase catalytic domain [Polyangiaceae bacterium]